MASRAEATKPVRGSVRLLFEYQGARVRLVERQQLEGIAPTGSAEPLPRRASGFWIELRDGADRRLYQRVVHQPVRFQAEVFGEKPGDRLEWRSVADPRGTFDLVVPDLPDAKTARLFSSPPEPERSSEPAVEILSVPLRGRSPRSRKDGG